MPSRVNKAMNPLTTDFLKKTKEVQKRNPTALTFEDLRQLAHYQVKCGFLCKVQAGLTVTTNVQAKVPLRSAKAGVAQQCRDSSQQTNSWHCTNISCIKRNTGQFLIKSKVQIPTRSLYILQHTPCGFQELPEGRKAFSSKCAHCSSLPQGNAVQTHCWHTRGQQLPSSYLHGLFTRIPKLLHAQVSSGITSVKCALQVTNAHM